MRAQKEEYAVINQTLSVGYGSVEGIRKRRRDMQKKKELSRQNDTFRKIDILTTYILNSLKWQKSEICHFDIIQHLFKANQNLGKLTFWRDLLSRQDVKIQLGKMKIFRNFAILGRCSNSARWQFFEFCHFDKLFHLGKRTICRFFSFWWDVRTRQNDIFSEFCHFDEMF